MRGRHSILKHHRNNENYGQKGQQYRLFHKIEDNLKFKARLLIVLTINSSKTQGKLIYFFLNNIQILNWQIKDIHDSIWFVILQALPIQITY